MYRVPQLHPPVLSCSAKAILASFTSLTVSVYSSTSLSTNFFLLLQFPLSKYSPTSHDLSHSHSQLLGFQINPLLNIHILYCIYQSILCMHTFIHLHSNVVYYCNCLHLIYIYTYTFHAILCALFH